MSFDAEHGFEFDTILPQYLGTTLKYRTMDAQKKYQTKFQVSDFESLYTFYTIGYNLRPQEISAFLGLGQMKNIDKYGQYLYI